MAIVVKDRVKVSTTTTGTGTITLGSADAGFQAFSVIGDGNQTYYAIKSGNNFEVGIGTYTHSGTTLSRDTVLESSNSGAKITLAGTSTVFTTYPAERAAFLEDTNQIDMVVASGSDPISPGNVVTRESNGQTKKVKRTTTTQNLSLGQSSSSTAGPQGNYQMGDMSYMGEYPTSTMGCANDSGRYCFVYGATSSRTYIQIFNYDSASSTWSIPSGDYRINSPDNNSVTGTAFQGTGSSFRSSSAQHYLRWHKNMNSSAGGTWFIMWHYKHSAGNESYYATPFTIDGSNVVNLFPRQKLIQRNDGTTADDFFTADSSVKSMTTDAIDFVTVGQNYVYYGHPYTSRFVISARRVTWTGSAYSVSDLGTSTVSSINGNSSQLTSQPRPVRVMYDYTNDYTCVFWLDTNRRNRFTVWENTGNANSYTWSPKYTEQLTTDNSNGTFDNNSYWNVQFQKADGKGRVVLSYMHKWSSNYYFRTFVIVPGSSSLTVTTLHSANASSTFNMSPAQMFLYDYLNDRYLSPYSSVYPIYGNGFRQSLNYYQPSGNSLSVETSVTGGGLNDAYQYGKFLAMVDTMSITSIGNANAGKWLQLHRQNQNTITSISVNTYGIYYSSGNIPHTLTTVTTNKALSFGFGQQFGSAGDTITVLPFNSEGIEQNQSSLTHGTKYYVSSTGALVTNTTPDPTINADTDNPLAGEAIQTTNLRLPTKEISDGGGGDARIFCGSYDFRVDGSSTAQNVLISLPEEYTAANVRSYEINVHALNFAGSGDFLCMLPYNGNSSVYTGPTYNTFTYMNSNSGNATNNSKTQSTAFILNWSNGTSYDLYSGNTATQEKQTYNNASGHGGQLVCRAVYTNSLRNGSLYYDASWRYESGNHSQSRVLSISSADAATTSNYADGFYFYCGNSSQATISRAIMEGVISVYAIIG